MFVRSPPIGVEKAIFGMVCAFVLPVLSNGRVVHAAVEAGSAKIELFRFMNFWSTSGALSGFMHACFGRVEEAKVKQ